MKNLPISEHDFKAAVLAEVKNLKAAVPAKTRAKLDIEKLDPLNGSQCVYGQMFEDWKSEKALKALKKCAVPFSDDTETYKQPENNDFVPRGWLAFWRTISHMEFYISTKGANIAAIVAYLKNERRTLTINDL